MLVRNGRELPLIPRYFDLLVFLVQHRQAAVHRREIFDQVWSDVVVSDSALSQAIRTLRRALDDDPREPRFIRTISRHGYRFVYDDVREEHDDGNPSGEPLTADARAPMVALIGSRVRQAVRVTPPQWVTACIGGGVAGIVAGIVGGVVLMVAPGSTASLAIIPVLALIGGACGAIGAAGVGAGLSVGEASTRSKRVMAIICGAAFGGTLVGAVVQYLGRWSLAAVVGLTVEIGGAVEGLVLGAAAGLGYAIATRDAGVNDQRRRLSAALLTASLCGLGALGLTRAGRPLVGGTLHAIGREARSSQMTLAPLGRLIGEPDFGPISQGLLGAGEGAVFGFGMAIGLTRRRSSRTSHESLTDR
jgi:DNA-binding winged helix-turn-helix (wHTH) protein